MTTRYLLELNGIGVFELANLGLDVRAPATIPQFADLSLVMTNDNGLARLLTALTTREAIASARVLALTSNGHGGEAVTYEARLQNVLVTSVIDTATNQNPPGYALSLGFGGIGVSTYDVAPDGTAFYTGGFNYTAATNTTTTGTAATPAPIAEPATAAVPVKYYMLINGLNGGSTDPGHVGWFELASVQDGITTSGTRPSLSSVSITMASDTGLGPVFYNLSAGRILTGARIEGVDAAGQSVYDLVLADVRISSAQDTSRGYGFALDYQRVQLTTDGGTSGGTPLPDPVFTWNVATNASAIGALPTLTVGAARAPDPAVTGYILKIAGVGEFNVADFSIGAQDTGSSVSGGGASGRISYQDLTITLTNDAGLTQLMAGLTAQTHYSRVDLVGLTPSPVNGASVISQDTILTDAWVTSIQDAGAGGGAYLGFGYIVRLAFRNVSMNTFAYDANGTVSSTGGYEFDIASNIIRSSSGTIRPTAVLSGTAAPVISDKYYLLVDGLNGGSTDPGHVGWFELPAFSAGASFNPTASVTAFQSISASLYGTAALGHLAYDVATGVHLAGARVEGARADGQVNYRLALGDVVVSSFQDASTVSGAAFAGYHQVSFDFSRYRLTTNADAAGGGLGPDQIASWDLVSRSSSVTLPTIAPGTGSGAANQVSSMVLKLANIGEFSVLSYSFGASNNATSPPSATTPTSNFQDIQVVVANDAGLVQLLGYVASNRHISSGALVGLTPSPLSGAPVISYDLELQNLVVSSITSTSNGQYAVSLNYASIAQSTYAYAQDGTRSLIDGFSYNLATGLGAVGGSTTPTASLVGTADPVAPVKYFLLVDGLNGSSLDGDHVGWFDLPGFGFGVTQSATAVPIFSTLSVDLYGDAGLGALLRIASADSVLRGIRIEGVRADGQRVYRLSLGNVRVDAVTDTSHGYSAAFSYNAIDLITNATLANNGLGGNVESDWDIAQRKAGAPPVTIAPVIAVASEGPDVLVGTNADDVVNALGGSDRVYGNAGNDTILGGGGDDFLSGGLGNDYLIGEAGNDTLDGGSSVNTLLGGAGNDCLIVGAGANGTTVDGGADIDTLVVTGAVSLGGLAGIEAIELQSGAALTLTATQFSGGLAPNATLSGTGSLTINMGAGDSELYLQQLVSAGGSSVAITVNGSANSDVIKGMLGSANTINGGGGDDQIRGGRMADTINGGDGDDKIAGGQGADILTGGAGAEVFRYQSASASGIGAAADHITDFVSGTDKLGFLLLDSNPNIVGIQGFSYIDTQAFHGTGAAEVRYGTLGADLLVQLDLNGDAVADMEILLQGLGGQSLASGDFLLNPPAGAQTIFVDSQQSDALHFQSLPPAVIGEGVYADTMVFARFDSGSGQFVDETSDNHWADFSSHHFLFENHVPTGSEFMF